MTDLLERRAPNSPCKEINIIEGRVDALGESFDRIESKVDKINETLQALIRIEERQGVMNTRLSDGSELMSSLGTRITKLEASDNKLAGSTKVIVWVVGVAQTIGIAIASAAWSNTSNTQAAIAALQIMDARLEARVVNMESKK